MTTEKDIHYGDDLNVLIRSGISRIYNPVHITLGSHGKYVAMKTEKGNRFTKDGVSIAKEVVVENQVENIFIRALVDASMATLSVIGDGTTSTIILAYHMIGNMMDSITKEDSKCDIKKFLDGVDVAMKYIEQVHADLKVDSKPSLEDLISVATTSSNGDKEFGNFIGNIYNKIGSEGIINLNYYDKIDMKVEYADGYIIDEGLLAYEFMSKNMNMAHMENPYVFVTNREIIDADKFLSEIAEVVCDMNDEKEEKRPLFVIAGTYSKEVLATMVKNRDTLFCVPLKAPSSGDMRNGYLEDIAKITGSTFINAEKDMHLSDYDLKNVLGSCKNIDVKLGETVITRSDDYEESIIQHLGHLTSLLVDSDDEISNDFINNRIVKINGSIANLFIKKSSLTEMSLNYDRYDDSIKATRNSIKNGVISGGGRVYMYMHKKLLENIEKVSQDSSFIDGYMAITDSLKSILMVNLKNSNHTSDEIIDITKNLSESDDMDLIYDTVKQGFCDPRKSGVLESYLSSIICIRNAFSVSKIIVNTGCAMVEVPKLSL